MARKNNKGFSLVEIIIAIAILTILAIPIVNQITQTFNTSRKSKKQQYAMDNAVYLMEDFQKSSLDELNDKYNYGNAPFEGSQNCEIYAVDGRDLGSVSYNYLKYNNIPSVQLGHDKSIYKRTVILDDLASSLLACDEANGKGYKISDIPVAKTGFEDNIMYDSDGLIVGAIVSESNFIANPNEVNLGNIQNLDSNTVAIINNDLSSIDADAKKILYYKAEGLIKKEASAKNIDLDTINVDNIYTQGKINEIKRLLKIYIDKNKDSANKEYYEVKLDVYYKITTTLNVGGSYIDFNETVNYDLYNKKFYMAECPNVYMQYQPFVVKADSTSAEYTDDDYILVDNYVKDAKIYLYKPLNDQVSSLANNGNAEYIEGGIFELHKISDPTSRLVKIHVCNATNDGQISTIYTNIKVTDDSFDTNAYREVADAVSTKNPAYTADDRKDYVDGTEKKVKEITDDTRYNKDRLYTVRVSLIPQESGNGNNPVILTGAKGEN